MNLQQFLWAKFSIIFGHLLHSLPSFVLTAAQKIWRIPYFHADNISSYLHRGMCVYVWEECSLDNTHKLLESSSTDKVVPAHLSSTSFPNAERDWWAEKHQNDLNLTILWNTKWKIKYWVSVHNTKSNEDMQQNIKIWFRPRQLTLVLLKRMLQKASALITSATSHMNGKSEKTRFCFVHITLHYTRTLNCHLQSKISCTCTTLNRNSWECIFDCILTNTLQYKLEKSRHWYSSFKKLKIHHLHAASVQVSQYEQEHKKEDTSWHSPGWLMPVWRTRQKFKNEEHKMLAFQTLIVFFHFK